MSATATSKIQAEEDEAPAPKAGRKRLPLMIAAIVALGAIGGGAYWFMGSNHAAEGAGEAAAKQAEAPPVYMPLERFTVNLQPEVGDQYLQVEASLRITDATAIDTLKARMPEIRNRMLLLLSSKRASELVTTAGKEKLGDEIQDEINLILEPPSKEDPFTETPPKDTAPDETATAAAAEGNAVVPPTASAIGEALSAKLDSVASANPAPSRRPAGPINDVLFSAFIIQ